MVYLFLEIPVICRARGRMVSGFQFSNIQYDMIISPIMSHSYMNKLTY